jgi:fructokinase
VTGFQPIAAIGEAVVDVVEPGGDEPPPAYPGGSSYNVAIGLARLGQPVSFLGRISRDPFGSMLRNHAQQAGVDLTHAVDTDDPTTLASVELDETGSARYRFEATGTADFRWTDDELTRVPNEFAAVHFGSLASWLPPGAAAIARRIAAFRDAGALISYDPNVRPLLQPDRTAARATIEATLPLAQLVKTSTDDLDWLRPGETAEQVAADWLDRGPELVIVTRGAEGATAFTTSQTITRPAVRVEVVDTVGAGDAFTSGLLDALARRNLLTPGALDTVLLADALDDAAVVAAASCTQAGAR